MSIAIDSPRVREAIFRDYTNEETLEFDRSEFLVSLVAGVDYVSRSQARRLLAGAERFRRIVVDLRGVTQVGQGFADELLRVYPSQHPGTTVRWKNAVENVEFMFQRAIATARK